MSFEKLSKYVNSFNDLDSIVKEIEKATHDNQVVKAWIIICKNIIKNDRLADAFVNVENLHMFHRELTDGVKSARDELIKTGKDRLKQVLKKEEFEKVGSAL